MNKAFQYPFNGQWLPNVEPLHVGHSNYKQLQNMRYTDTGVETCEGYSKITTNAMSQTPVSGFHFKTDNVSEVITKAYTGSYYLLYRNTTAIPGTGDYTATDITQDTFYSTFVTLDSSPGWFSNGPNGLMLYADDGIGPLIYGGDNIEPHVIFVSSDATLPIPEYNEFTDDSINSDSYFTYNSATQPYLYIGSPWLITDLIIDVRTANVTTSTLTMNIWDGSAWTAKTITDGTSSGGIALAQDGNVELAYNSVTPKVAIINNQQLYWYRLVLSAGSAALNSIKLRVPVQRPTDVWNGSGRTCIGFYLYRNGEYEDYTYNVASPSTVSAPFAATLGGADGSDFIELIFEEPIQGLIIKMLEGLTNKNAVTVSYVKYWNGITFTDVGGIIDETLDGGSTKTLNQSGVLSWSSQNTLGKARQTHGVFGYPYRIYLSGAITDAQRSITSTSISFTNATSTINLSSGSWPEFRVGDEIYISGSSSNNSVQTISQINGANIIVYGTLTDEAASASVTILSYEDVKHDGVSIDTVYGITMPLTMTGYNGVGFYAGRALLIDKNRIDYSLPNEASIYNGVNTSNRGAPNPNSLFFGDTSAITKTHSLFNRYGSNIIESLVITKKSETHLLTGSQPYSDFGEPFVKRTISTNYGCPAPMTMQAVEVGYEVGQGALRNALIWLDATGPIMFDGAIIAPIPGIENYFDPTKSEYIKTSIIEKSTAYYDSTHSEYNLLFPSGSSATANNVWLVYDLRRRRWYQKVPTTYYPIYTITVKDTDGVKYGYGHLSTKHLMRLDNAQAWDGSAISQVIQTGEFSPSFTDEFGFWTFSEISNLKLISKVISEDADVTMVDFGSSSTACVITGDCAAGQTCIDSLCVPDANKLTVALDSGTNVSRNIASINKLGVQSYTHSIRFSTSTSSDKWAPLFWGYKAVLIRED